MARQRPNGRVEEPASEPFTFDAVVWEWNGPAAWHFVSLPEDLADLIDEQYGELAAGFGSVRVEVGIGDDVWRTSLFPDTKLGTYLLPVKAAVRRRHGLVDGTSTTLQLTVLRPAG